MVCEYGLSVSTASLCTQFVNLDFVSYQMYRIQVNATDRTRGTDIVFLDG